MASMDDTMVGCKNTVDVYYIRTYMFRHMSL